MSEPDFVKRVREYQRAHYQANREKKIAYQRAYREANEAKIKQARRAARIAAGLPVRDIVPLASGVSVKDYNKIHHSERRCIALLEERITCLQIVAGARKPVCVACGCDDIFVLTVNHKNGGGRKETGTNPRAMRLKILNGQRAINDLDVRCQNCNILYEYERGYRKMPRGASELIQKLTEE